VIWWIVAAGTVLGLGLAIGVPYFVIKPLGVGLYTRARMPKPRAIAITIDDGPDPKFTPHVLDVLAAHGVKATFFVVGERAEAHPDLIQRIAAEGHELASHSYTHRHALFDRKPLEGWYDTRRGVQHLEAMLGQRTRWFRAPWGAYSWSVLAAVRAHGLVPVNWSIESRDWHPEFRPPDVVARVLGAAAPGAIIVMHDSGRGATKMIHAIDPILHGLRERGLLPGPLSQLERDD